MFLKCKKLEFAIFDEIAWNLSIEKCASILIKYTS